MQRREFVAFLAGATLAGSRTAFAQSSKVYRLGTLTAVAPISEKSPPGAVLLQVLEQRGYTLGKNLVLDARSTAGQVSKLPEVVRAMKADNVDVFVTTGFPATLACKVEKVPTVVAVGAGDPVATHLIEGLARPGGNITGISDNSATLSTKRLALIKQAVPNLKRVAMLWNRDDLGMSQRYDVSADAARSIGAGARRARARRLQRGVRGYEPRPAGCHPDGRRLAHQPQPKARV